VANLLINEIKKESRKNEIDKINDLRISKIRDLTERCLNPNPFERPEAVMLYEEVELLNIELESSLAEQPFS
jgi:serine/threonine protein kinase